MIIQVRVVLRKTVALVTDRCFNYLSGSHLQSQVRRLCHQMMVFMPLVVVWIGQFCCDAIGCDVIAQDYPHLEDHTKHITTDTPGFKPFTMLLSLLKCCLSKTLKTQGVLQWPIDTLSASHYSLDCLDPVYQMH